MGLASSLMAVSAGAQIAGGYEQAQGDIAQGKAEAASANYNSQVATLNATLANQNAAWAEQEGVSQESVQEEKNRLQGGQIKAAQGANNISVNGGSALATQQSQRVAGEMSSMDIMSNAARQAFGYEAQAGADVGQAGLYSAEAQYAPEAANIAAAGSLLGTASSVGSKYAMWEAQGSSPQAQLT